MKSLGKLLRDARLEKNLKIREVSRKLGISAMYISELETEKKIPLDSTCLEKISIFYGLSYTKVKEAAEFTKSGIISRLDDQNSSSEQAVAARIMLERPDEAKKFLENLYTKGKANE